MYIVGWSSVCCALCSSGIASIRLRECFPRGVGRKTPFNQANIIIIVIITAAFVHALTLVPSSQPEPRHWGCYSTCGDVREKKKREIDSSGEEDVFNAAGAVCLDLVGIRAHRDRKLVDTPPFKSVGTSIKLETKNLLIKVLVYLFLASEGQSFFFSKSRFCFSSRVYQRRLVENFFGKHYISKNYENWFSFVNILV